MKKIFKKLISICLVSVLSLSFAACAGREGEKDSYSVDPKVINVRIVKAGHGTTYIYALKEKFEKLYEKEGYKVNVLVPLSGITGETVNQSIYSNEGVDMFFVGQTLEDGVAGEYGQLYADITQSVYKQKPIRFDGTEEDQTVEEKLNGLVYDNSYNGKYYGLPYTFTVMCLGVNTKAMNEYTGMTIPRTSNELFDCFKTIMSSASETGVFPYTYSLQLNDYPMVIFRQWMVQYGGLDEVKEFWTMQDRVTGENLAKPYEVFNSDAIRESLKAFYQMMDYNTASFGASTQNFKSAQNQWMNGDAVFYSVGSWAYNEEKVRNENKLNDITMTRVPVLSALGTKMFGSKTEYNYDDEKCEQILCAIIDGIDANKEASTIQSEVNIALQVNLKEEDVLQVCQNIGLVSGNSNIETAIISEKSTKKDICSLFFRMCTSDDGASLIAHETLTANPFKLDALSDVNSSWHREYSKLIDNRYMKQFPISATGYRYQLGLNTFSPYTGVKLHVNILDDRISIYNNYTYKVENETSIYNTPALNLANTIYSNAKLQYESGLWN